MKRLALSIALAVVGSVTTGCFNTTLGLSCETSQECQDGQACLVAPNGFCSRGCTEPGQSRDCPTGALCTYFHDAQLVCSLPCETDANCRENFECVLTHQGSTVSACRPKKS